MTRVEKEKETEKETENDNDNETEKQPIFKLPIEYIENKTKIEQHIITDLELVDKTETHTKSLYNYVFNPSNTFSEQTIALWSQYYTSDKQFLKDSQKIIKQKNQKNQKNQTPYLLEPTQVDNVLAIMNEIDTTTGSSFNDKYYYIDIQMFEAFNNNSQFLQWLSIYNMSSPVFSLLLPILFLIFPLLLLKLQGVPISVSKYVEILKQLFARHSIGQLFHVGSASWDKLIYIMVSVGFYFLQIYQNIVSCFKFYRNMKKIHQQLFTIRDYLDKTLQHMTDYNQMYTKLKLTTYEPFINVMNEHSLRLLHFKNELDQIAPNKVNIKKFKQIGHIMKCFYQLYKNKEYSAALHYSFGFNGYLDNLRGLKSNIKNKHIAACKIKNSSCKTKTKTKTKFTKAYFPALVHSNPIKNSYTLDKHILLTGPNAAGKTTLLKTTIFNIILSQQMGCGFYKSATLEPYDSIHCYINIPDTSARDSLFQAEARRCKDILTHIETSRPTHRHFCVFDELYSGTNPYEAIGSAFSFLKYLNKHDNVTFMLTTHYLDLCKRLDVDENITNFHMEIEQDTNTADSSTKNKNINFNYTYKMVSGISTIKGGIKVLIDLNYPKEIIDNTHRIIKELVI